MTKVQKKLPHLLVASQAAALAPERRRQWCARCKTGKGMYHPTKTDEFLEKFQMAFDNDNDNDLICGQPPPPQSYLPDNSWPRGLRHPFRGSAEKVHFTYMYKPIILWQAI